MKKTALIIALLLLSGCGTKPSSSESGSTTASGIVIPSSATTSGALSLQPSVKTPQPVAKKRATRKPFSYDTEKVKVDDICSSTVSPVCGKRPVVCIKAPCDPVPQTFENRCLAERAGALEITEGACK